MRITKKFAGSNGIGKQVFSPCAVSDKSNDVRRALFAELDALERVFLQKVESSHSISFPVSAKALAFSAKLQMKVQQAPSRPPNRYCTLLNRILKSSHGALRFGSVGVPDTKSPLAASTSQPNFNEYAVGDKRALADVGGEERGSRRLIASDIDASNLLLNFFKATREISDSNDSDSSESNEVNGNLSSGSTSISGRTTCYDSSGTNGSGSDDQEGEANPSCMAPF